MNIDDNKMLEANNIFEIGKIKLENEDLEGAIGDFDRAIEINPKISEYYTYRGNAYIANGNFWMGYIDYEKALKLNPNDLIALNNRGIANCQRQDYKAAIKDLDRVLEIHPNALMALYYRSIAKFHRDEPFGSIADCDLIIKNSPNFSEAYLQRGVVYFSLKMRNEAHQDWEKAIELGNALGLEFKRKCPK